MKIQHEKIEWREWLKKPFVTVDIDDKDFETTRVNVGVRVDFAIAVALLAAVFLFSITG